jgi:hypothetical protein
MKARRLVVPVLLVWGVALAAISCSAILGIEDTRVTNGDGGPEPVCVEPTETACSGTCVDTTTQAANCGACGHDCGDGTCSDGKCQPVTIAGQLDAPYSMAVTPSGEQIFWITATDVQRCPIAGCGVRPARIAELGTLTSGRRDRIVATNDEVFWIGKQAGVDVLFSCPTAGCNMGSPSVKTGHTLDTPRVLTLAANAPGAPLLAVQKFQARQCMQAGGCTDLCGSADSMQSAVLDEAGRLYWLETTDPAGLYACSAAGGAAARLTAESGQVVRLVGDTLYVLRQFGDVIYRCAKSGCSGSGTPLVNGQLSAGSLAVDARGIYWTVPGSDTAATGEVRTCPSDGCGAAGPRVLASGLARPTDVKVQGDDVLWVNQGLIGVASSGSVMRVRK